MSRSSTATLPKIPTQLPQKSAWAKGPPLNTAPSPRSQSPAPNSPVNGPHPAHSPLPSAGQRVAKKDSVSIPRNKGRGPRAAKQGSAVIAGTLGTFGSIGSAPILSSPSATPAIKSDSVKSGINPSAASPQSRSQPLNPSNAPQITHSRRPSTLGQGVPMVGEPAVHPAPKKDEERPASESIPERPLDEIQIFRMLMRREEEEKQVKPVHTETGEKDVVGELAVNPAPKKDEERLASESISEKTLSEMFRMLMRREEEKKQVHTETGEKDVVEEPAVWLVILWVAFQVKTRVAHPPLERNDLGALLTIIESNADEHTGLWSWDDTDDQMLRKMLLPLVDSSSWIDRYPPEWREYIVLVGSQDWARLGDLTRQSSRVRLDPPEYDSAIRVGAIVLWTCANSVSSSELTTILTLHRFVPGGFLSRTYTEFLTWVLEGRANHYVPSLSPDTVNWDHPQLWLERTRSELRSRVLHNPDAVPLVHVVENVYMMYHMSHSLPQCFISSVFALLMKKFGCDTRLDEFRAQIIIWVKWDLVTCLINFRPVLGRMLEFSRLIEDEEIQRAISVLVHADIFCICAQFAGILLDPNTSKDLLKAQDDHAQELLDLLQDLLDYPRLDSQIWPVLLRGLLKLSKKFKQHPRCFALPDLQLGEDPVAAGGFGDIWKSQFHNETVCVKVMRVYQKSDVNTLLKEVYHEALIWRQLAHPNLLPFFGVYFLQNERSRLCLVSPWLENGNISVYLKRNPVGSNRLTLVLDVALGLEHLHSLKLVHGDLKGLNVLVTHSGVYTRRMGMGLVKFKRVPFLMAI